MIITAERGLRQMDNFIQKNQEKVSECVKVLLADIGSAYREYTSFCERMSILLKPREHLFPDKEGGKQFVVVVSYTHLDGGTGQPYAFLVLCSDKGYGGARLINSLESQGKMVFALHFYDDTIRYYASPSWLPSASVFAEAVGASLSIPLVKALKEFGKELKVRISRFIDERTKACEKWLREHEDDLKVISAMVVYRNL